MIFNKNIEAFAKINSFFLQVLVTGNHLQILTMSIPQKGEMGEVVHDGD